MLATRLNNLFDLNQEAWNLNEIALQKQAAAKLRAAVIEYLRKGQGVTAKSFRGEYYMIGEGSYETFLDRQARNGEWGTYIEATALAEMTGCSLVVTPVTKGVKQAPFCLYRAADPKAPVIELYNSDNVHWYINNNTLGDGNCLFNSMAVAFQKAVKPAQLINNPSTQPKFFDRPELERKTLQQQETILAAIQKQLPADQLQKQLEEEAKRIARLPLHEQQQIKADYQLALKLARESDSSLIVKVNHDVGTMRNAPLMK